MPIIGLPSTTNRCIICDLLCSSERALNALTLDLILERRTHEQIIQRFSVYFAIFKFDVEEALTMHSSHCSRNAVPDDYFLHPELYEDGDDVVGPDIHKSPWNRRDPFLILLAAMRDGWDRIIEEIEQAREERKQHERQRRLAGSPPYLLELIDGESARPKVRKRSRRRPNTAMVHRKVIEE